MDWFNFYGVGAMLCLLLPNAIYSAKPHDTQEHCSTHLIVLETILRFGCMALMVVRFDFADVGFANDADRLRWFWWVGSLIALYWACWLLFARKGACLWTTLPLTLLPCAVFILTGVWMQSPALIVCGGAFAVVHLIVSLVNTLYKPTEAPPEDAAAAEASPKK